MKLYVTLLALAIELTKFVKVTFAITVPSLVGPELSWISWTNIISGVRRRVAMWDATVGRCVEVGAMFSTYAKYLDWVANRIKVSTYVVIAKSKDTLITEGAC